MTLDTLRRASLEDLEWIYAQGGPLAVPGGLFGGLVLGLVDSAGARRRANRAMVWLGFSLPRFGVDFQRRAWWFHHPLLRVGAFEARPGPSRWRDAQTMQLHYHPSRLPGPVKHLLYDEVKPLGEHLCLGLGGINQDRGEGDLFFFALSRIHAG